MKGRVNVFLEQRQQLILEELTKAGAVRVKDLAAHFNVTDDSIRKDLAALESDGKLRRTYGGAVSLQQNLAVNAALNRRLSAVASKRAIANAALHLFSLNINYVGIIACGGG